MDSSAKSKKKRGWVLNSFVSLGSSFLVTFLWYIRLLFLSFPPPFHRRTKMITTNELPLKYDDDYLHMSWRVVGFCPSWAHSSIFYVFLSQFRLTLLSHYTSEVKWKCALLHPWRDMGFCSSFFLFWWSHCHSLWSLFLVPPFFFCYSFEIPVVEFTLGEEDNICLKICICLPR